MKKLLVGMVVAAVMAIGLVGVSSSTATAAPNCEVYTGCPETVTTLRGPSEVDDHSRPELRVKVELKSGIGAVKGQVKVVCKSEAKKRTRAIRYDDDDFKTFLGPRMSKTSPWVCTARFRSTKFTGSSDTISIDVK